MAQLMIGDDMLFHARLSQMLLQPLRRRGLNNIRRSGSRQMPCISDDRHDRRIMFDECPALRNAVKEILFHKQIQNLVGSHGGHAVEGGEFTYRRHGASRRQTPRQQLRPQTFRQFRSFR